MNFSEINIPSYIDDIHYRYKMPRMQLKTESKGNGKKTNIVNLKDVSKALRVPTEYPIKYFALELGAIMETKNKAENEWIIKGQPSFDELAKLLDKFIERYLLCPKCHLPELFIYVKNDKVRGKCNADGKRVKFDSNDKMVAYILKNPPKTVNLMSKEGKKSTSDKTKEKHHTSGSTKDSPKKEKSSSKTQGKEISEKLSNLYSLSSKDEALSLLKEYWNSLSDITVVEKVFKIVEKVIHDDMLPKWDLISEFLNYISVENNTVAMHCLIYSFGYLYLTKFKENLKYFTTVCKYLFDSEIISEEAFLSFINDDLCSSHPYYQKEEKAAIVKEITPFIDWLKSADEENSEEEDNKEEIKKIQKENKEETVILKEDESKETKNLNAENQKIKKENLVLPKPEKTKEEKNVKEDEEIIDINAI